MSDLTEFQRGKIIGARMMLPVNKVAEVFGVSRGTVSKITRSYKKTKKTATGKHQRGRKYVLTDRGRRALHRVVIKHTQQQQKTRLSYARLVKVLWFLEGVSMFLSIP